jgi:hypothetical protein
MTTQTNKQSEPLNILFSILLVAAAMLLFAYHMNVVSFPYPLEYREGAMIQTTNTLLTWENPYTIENQPQDTNVYGILYSIVCYPFAKIFGSGLQLHRAVSGIFILLSCLVVFLFARTEKHHILPSLTVSLILYASLLYGVTPLVRPDSLGLFLFLLSLYLPLRYGYSLRSLFISAFIGVFAFLTKTFFLLTYPLLGSYVFLFVSKKYGITYGVFSFIILIVTSILMSIFFETYIANVFFNHINLANYSIKHVISQLFSGIKSYAFIFIVFFFAVLSIALKRKQQVRLWITNFNLSCSVFSFLNMRNPNSSFFMFTVKGTSYYLLCAAIIFCLTLGGHKGAWMTYVYQLIAPFFLLVLLDVTAYSSIPRSFLYIVLGGIINLGVFYTWTLPHYTYPQVQPQWQKIYELVSKNNTIFNSPAITPILQEQNKRVYDSGQTEYFRQGFLPKMFSFFFPYRALDNKIAKGLERYQRDVVEAVKSRKFDVIFITSNYKCAPFAAESLLPKYYERKTTLSAPMPHTKQKWLLDVWIKKAGV